MKKNCIKCSQQFEVTQGDNDFYNKLNIPEPTHCPTCRVKRRMMWRNDRVFYNRKCDKSGNNIVSTYPKVAPFPVYHPDDWYGDGWNALDYGQDLTFDRPFFEQWLELRNKVPRLGIDIVNCENSYYCNYCGDDKNCFLDIAGEGNEDCYYNLFTKYSKDCADCTFVYNSELAYESINCYRCNNVRFSMYLENCHDCAFCFDLKGCNNCLFSNNLRHKEYYIFNKSYSKEEYEKKLNELRFGSYESQLENIKKWKENMKKAVHRDMYTLNSENCTGNNINNSKNCHFAFNIGNCEDCKYLFDVLEAKDCYDLNYSLYKPEVACELISTLSMRFSAFNMASHYCNNVFYCDQSNNSSNIFGCIGLTHKEYCILNKQYSKEEYEDLVSKLIEHMKSTGEWGEFFPSSISPFAYNETVIQEYFPLTKEQALAQGYQWKDKDKSDYMQSTNDVPDKIFDVPASIVNEVLACIDCGKNFKITSQELNLYRKLNLPAPRKCPDCRHMDRMKLRNPRKLMDDKCDKCGIEIRTTYSKDRPEKVYCEKCYLEAVY